MIPRELDRAIAIGSRAIVRTVLVDFAHFEIVPRGWKFVGAKRIQFERGCTTETIDGRKNCEEPDEPSICAYRPVDIYGLPDDLNSSRSHSGSIVVAGDGCAQGVYPGPVQAQAQDEATSLRFVCVAVLVGSVSVG